MTKLTIPNPPKDPLFASKQWYLQSKSEGSINIGDLWSEYSGEGVTVGIFDIGVEFGIGELNANASGLIFNTEDGSTIQPFLIHDHGTMCAGLVAAESNVSLMVGVAYHGAIASIYNGMSPSTLTNEATGAGFDFALDKNIDIVNCSWGFSTDFFYDNPTSFQSGLEAIADAAEQGRDGKGTVIVFAAGNSRYAGDDVNLHSFQNDRHVITVGATDSAARTAYNTYPVKYFDENGKDHVAKVSLPFSSQGAALLVSAPGQAVLSTTRSGGTDYDSGTSFSAPIVSGVAALMLQANPDLGWRDIQQILAATAVKVGSGSNYNHAAAWNGGGMHVSDDFGYGLVDAHAAVRLAESWLLPTGAPVAAATSSNEAASPVLPLAAADVNQYIADGGSLSTTISSGLAAGNPELVIEHVQVHIDLAADRLGDLVIRLISPSGTTSTLLDRPGVYDSRLTKYGFSTTGLIGAIPADFVFTSVQFMGESNLGDWSLEIVDKNKGSATDSFLYDWDIQFFGREKTVDSRYVFTDEFAAEAKREPERMTLGDADGGIDTINAAAVTTKMTIDLAAGKGSIAGARLVLAPGTEIENVIGGDGGDSLTGNAAANFLYGMRGNDKLYGGIGNDWLDGGRGNDIMDGGSGNDTFIIDGAGDKAVESLAGVQNGGLDTAIVTSAAALVYVLPTGMDNATLTGATGGEALGAKGNDLDNIIAGNMAGNLLDGGKGADVLAGGAGDDIYIFDNPLDQAIELPGAGADTVKTSLNAGLGAFANVETYIFSGKGGWIFTADPQDAAGFTLIGGGGGDLIAGGMGNDRIDGGKGIDLMLGGAGKDTYVLDHASDAVLDYGSDAGDTILASVAIDLAARGLGVENVALQGVAALSAVGNDLDNALEGNDGGNLLDGGKGADVLAGGDGSDTYIVDDAGDVVIEASAGAKAGKADLVKSSVSFSLGDNVENLILTGSKNTSATGNGLGNVILGNGGNNVLFGAAGNDRLDGGEGGDFLDGGAGDDVYVIDAAKDKIVEAAPAGGEDVVRIVGSAVASFSLDKLANVENLDFSAATPLAGAVLTGNKLDNQLLGSGGNDVIAGGAGDDLIMGGKGIDTVVFSGRQSDYVIAKIADGVLSVTDTRKTGNDGKDVLIDIQVIQFKDGKLSGPTAMEDGDGAADALAENLATGALVHVTAAAAGKGITYSLAGNPGGLFAINGASGVVTTMAALDYESAGPDHRYLVTIRATDVLGLSIDRDFVIDVLDVNEAPGLPSDADKAANVVALGAMPGDKVGLTVLAGDPDAGDMVTYSLADDAGGRFQIDAASGVVSIAAGASFDPQAMPSHVVTVVATDKLGLLSSKDFTIFVAKGINTAPGALADADASPDRVAEGAVAGTAVGIAALSLDPDAGDTVTYSLLDDAGGRFQIDAQTGLVSVKNGVLLDYESAASHAITVMAADGSGSFVTKDFTIALGNIADQVKLADLQPYVGCRLVAPLEDGAGVQVASAGDINGDGLPDLVMSGAGLFYFVFGQPGGFAAEVDLAALNAASGGYLTGNASKIALLGDINGDGLDDLALGDRDASPNGKSDAGSSYVVFGAAGGYPGSLAMLDGLNGFRLDGVAKDDWSGHSLSSAGDVNGDGFQDLIIGAFLANPGGKVDAGASYVVFGKATGFLASMNLSSLDGTNGFRLDGAVGEESGVAVAGIGDWNNDGFDDLAIGAPYSAPTGKVYIMLGKASGFTASIGLSSLTGEKGGYFEIKDTITGNNIYAGSQVCPVGDINADGYDDAVVLHIIPGLAQEADVLLGKAGVMGMGASIGLFSYGDPSPSNIAQAAHAGDVNGDGYDDMLLLEKQMGKGFVIFGSPEFQSVSYDLSSLKSSEGFEIKISTDGGISAAGDVNGDGFDDLLIGSSSLSDANGQEASGGYIIYGSSFGLDSAPVIAAGGIGQDVLVGGVGDDLLAGKGGADIMRTGAGADVIEVADKAFSRIDGGSGIDRLVFAYGGAVDLGNIDGVAATSDRNRIEDVEILDFANGMANAILLHVADLLSLDVEAHAVAGVPGLDNVLRIDGAAGEGDTLTLLGAEGWTLDNGVPLAGYDIYAHGALKVAVDLAIGVGFA